jgi:hypothetical protein
MFRKYLLKRDFWAVPKRNGDAPNCYVRHDIKVGGIYAYLENRGVKIVNNNEEQFFNNFDELDRFLDKMSMNATRSGNETSDFLAILNRRMTSNLLRKIPM